MFVKLSLNVPYVCFQAKKISLSACLRDTKSQTYSIYTCTGSNEVNCIKRIQQDNFE